MKFILFLTLIIVLSITSCEKQCINANLRFGLVGFSDTEADTIILRRFTKNDPLNPQDTFILTQILFYRQNDTLDIAGIPGEYYLESKYNYEIFLPAVGELFTVSDILENKETMTKGLFNCTKEACVNTITGYTVNGQFSNSILYQEFIYLKK